MTMTLIEARFAGIRRWCVALSAAMAGALLALPVGATSFSEPCTVFYGRVIAGGSTQPYLLTEGNLTWMIRRADGMGVTLTTKLRPLNDGQYSYQLSVPHEALAAGLEGSQGSVLLGPLDQTQTHFRIAINNASARILGPSGAAFDVSQARRAATYRLDLEVSLGTVDSDGDGIPDWWASKYGVNDATADPDGDGRNNLAEFNRNSNPNHDDRAPTLVTREIRAYAEATTVVLLQAVDSDSAPTNVIFTLNAAPGGGSLHLRGSAGGNRTLVAGDTFSLEDVNRGRLVFAHSDAEPGEASSNFEVTLRDENPAHSVSTNTVAVNIYRPNGVASVPPLAAADASRALTIAEAAGFLPEEQPFVMNYLLGRDLGYVICDGSGEARNLELALPSSGLTRTQYLNQFVPSFGADQRHVLQGGAGGDRVSGSMEDDIIIGGLGTDSLRGNGGSDRFVFLNSDDGNDVIEDFNLAEADVIDISRLLVGSSRYVTNYVQLTSSGTNSYLGLNFSGTGPGFSNLVITLAGVHLVQADLRGLVEQGSLITGTRVFAPSVSVVATKPAASENGPVAGEFTLTRSTDLGSALTVNLQITGSAANGVDYAYIDPQVTFAPGQKSVAIPVTPYVDAITELSEVVQLGVLSGAGYEVATGATAQIVIEDLAPQISIEALESVAVKNDLTPGLFLITRAGVLDRSVLVRLNVAGTATKNSDYETLPTFVNLLPGQTTALLSVNPKSSAVLNNGMEFVELSVKADTTYVVTKRSSARVLIVDEQMTFSLWRQRNFPALTGDLSFVAVQDPDQTGTPTIFRYAFGLDPKTPQRSPGGPEFRMRDGRMTVVFRRPAALTDVQYRVEVSEDLVTWHEGAGYAEEFIAPEYVGQPEMAGYRASKSAVEAPRQFMRVSVIHTP